MDNPYRDNKDTPESRTRSPSIWRHAWWVLPPSMAILFGLAIVLILQPVLTLTILGAIITWACLGLFVNSDLENYALFKIALAVGGTTALAWAIYGLIFVLA